MTEFFASPNVQAAILASAIVAALSAAIGYFVVLRGLSFAGHAVTDIGLTGGAGAMLAGIDPLFGLIAFSVGAASTVGAFGARARERDLATGLVLAFALGLGAVFLHLQTKFANAQSTLLFGSLFDTDPALLRVVACIGAFALVALATMYRPLLFSSVAPEAARGAGVPARALGFAFLIVMALGVAETAQIVGVLIATALLVGPAATAMTFVRDPARCVACAIFIGVAEMWLAIVLAFVSFDWSRGAQSWPVSFFVAALALAAFVAARAYRSARAR
ncbi:MAG: metal ABC transporter permease [Candidatus Eremiobacteraeota bacterium]|nr:metal ABC transporter permease [Candidatus Eremiobacteraeota bacterium]